MSTTSFDADLVRRHDRHGPRYTSYPTAVQFHTGFDAGAYRRAAFLSNAFAAKPLSAYVHVPFCVSPCFYCGCNKIVTRDVRQATQYLRHLATEIELQSHLFDRRRWVRQLHFGGGTPTFFSPAQLGEVLGQLRQHFTLDDSPEREMSIEIDPRTIDSSSFQDLAALGFNRASLGVQDFDPNVQKAVNRRQSVEQAQATLSQARAAGFRSVSFDLIYGLPLQTVNSFADTLDTAIRMRPDRIAAYGYAHMPRLFKAQRAIDARQLPDAEVRLQLLQLTVERLTDAGYVHIGMDHFALPEDELAQALRLGNLQRNFQGYSTRAECDLIGFGVSAIGSVGNVYSQNYKRLTDYYRALESARLPVERGVELHTDDLARREIIQRIMCNGVLDFAEIEAAYALDFDTYFARELSCLRDAANDGLLSIADRRIVVTGKGRFLLRTIAMAFDAYVGPAAAERFSKVI